MALSMAAGSCWRRINIGVTGLVRCQAFYDHRVCPEAVVKGIPWQWYSTEVDKTPDNAVVKGLLEQQYSTQVNKPMQQPSTEDGKTAVGEPMQPSTEVDETVGKTLSFEEYRKLKKAIKLRGRLAALPMGFVGIGISSAISVQLNPRMFEMTPEEIQPIL